MREARPIGPPRALLGRVARFIARHDLIRVGDTVVVAVSGGVDSCVLLDLLEQLSPSLSARLVVAHVHHGLRGAEADRDERFVKGLAGARGLPYVVGRLRGLKEAAGRQGVSLQAAARDARYAFLAESREARGARVVALGHTMTDQAETILERVLRGAGTDGLGGMAPVRDGWVVRPLLCATRDEVLAYARFRGLTWVEDGTNVSPAYTRNRIRLHVWPALLAENPNLERALARLAEVARRDTDLLDKLTETVWNSSAVQPGVDRVEVSVGALLEQHPALRFRLLRKAVRVLTAEVPGVTVGHDHLAAVLDLAERGGGFKALDLPGGLRVELEPERLVVARRAAADGRAGDEVELAIPGATSLPTGETIRVDRVPRAAVEGLRGHARECWLEEDRVDGRLWVRYYRRGDRFHPFGAPGPVRLSRFFIREKIPRARRQTIPLVLMGGRIVWVVGVRGSEYTRISGKSERVLRLRLEEPGEGAATRVT